MTGHVIKRTYVFNCSNTDKGQVVSQQGKGGTGFLFFLVGGDPVGRRPLRDIPVGETDGSERLLGVENNGLFDAVLDLGVESFGRQAGFGSGDDILVGHAENDFTGTLDQETVLSVGK